MPPSCKIETDCSPDTVSTHHPMMKQSPQATMFAKADRNNHTIYIARWLESGKFAYQSHPTIQDWLNHYQQIKDEDKRMYGEIHREGKAVCEYYDIDEKQKGQDIDEWIEGFLKTRNEFSTTQNIPQIRKNQLLILEACDDKKFSLHILVRNKYHFKTIADHKLFARKFQNWLDVEDRGVAIDTSVYNKNSVFRCIYSHKPNQTRTFKFHGEETVGKWKMEDAFCSTIHPRSIPHTITEDPKATREIVPHIHTDDAILNMFWKLDKDRWDDRETWRNLIWLGIKEGISRDDLCELSAQSYKHQDEAVDLIINGKTRYDACGITVGSLKFYLRQDLGDEEYFKLFPKKQTDRLTASTLWID